MFSQGSAPRQPRQQIPGNIILWFIILGLTVLLIPIFLFSRSLNQDVQQLEGTVIPLETAVSGNRQLTPSAPSIAPELIELNEQVAQIDGLQPTLDAQQIEWSNVMQAVRTFDDAQLSIVSLVQAPGRLTIRGRAINEQAITGYANQLEQSGAFSSVLVQSILAVETPFVIESPTPPGPTPTPSPTNQPTAVPTQTRIPSTPTPDLTDEFEWDDHTAQPIFLGQSQTHNFLPNFDVDNVFFLAKAGRFYQIRTTNLAAGVDTFLTVSMGDQTFTNDDIQNGTLTSLVEVQAPADQDINVFVRITNRGSFGADKTYQISVQEIVPTAVPTTMPLTPVPTFTATPDLRDAYEPDDPPTLLAVGESQVHTFFPSVDEDYLQILVKEGRNYQITTSSLAVGVDTIVTVDLDSVFTQNDDYSPLGSDDLSSSICFSASKDSVALIEILNKSQQYDPNKRYTVTASEVPFSADTQEIDFGTYLEGNTTVSDTVSLSSSTNMSFTIQSNAPWLFTDLTSGTTNISLSTFNIIADTSGLLPGEYEGAIDIIWGTACHQQIPVFLQIERDTSQIPSHDVIVADQIFDGATRPYKIRFKRVQQSGSAFEFIIIVEFDTE